MRSWIFTSLKLTCQSHPHHFWLSTNIDKVFSNQFIALRHQPNFGSAVDNSNHPKSCFHFFAHQISYLAHTVVVDIVVVEDKAGRMGCILLVEAAALHNRTGDYHMERRASVAGDTPLAGRERSLGQLEAPRKEPVVQRRVRMAQPPRPARQVAPPERKRVELRQWLEEEKGS